MDVRFHTIKRTIIAFASLFTNLHLYRYNDDGSLANDIVVEICLANKSKFYQRINNNINAKQAITLPAISIYNSSIDYLLERQQNELAGIECISKENEDILNFVGAPIPIRMTFEVVAACKFLDDAVQLLETIPVGYRPTKTKRVNMVPRYGIVYNMPITLQGFQTNFEIDLGQDSSQTEVYDTTYTFAVDSFIFPPSVEQFPARTIKRYMLAGAMSSETVDSTRSDDINNEKQVNISLYDTPLVGEFEVTFTAEKNLVSRFENISSIISAHGEKLKVLDEQDNEVEFVFEYSTGKLYGSDYLVPVGESTTKTGRIAFVMKDVEARTYKFLVKQATEENKEFAKNIFPMYEDFNRSNFNRLRVENKSQEHDDIYIVNNLLRVKAATRSISEMAKVYTEKSITGSKYFEVGISSFTFTSSCYLFGIGKEDGDYLYLKTGATASSFELHSFISNVDTLITIFSYSTLSKIKFVFDAVAVNWKIYIDGTIKYTYSGTEVTDYYIPFVTWNGASETAFSYLIGGFE